MTPELMRVEAASTAHIPQLVTLDQLVLCPINNYHK